MLTALFESQVTEWKITFTSEISHFEKKLEAIKENTFRKIYLDILLFLSHKNI